MQKKNGDIIGLAILVFITDIATKAPKKQEPLSPRKTLAFGKLNSKKIANTKIPKNKKLTKSAFPFK